MTNLKGNPNWWTKTTLKDLISIKHWYAFKWEFITDEDNWNILLTPWNFLIWWGWKDWKKRYKWEIPNDYILQEWDLVVTMTDLSKDGDTLWYPALIPNNTNKTYLHNQRIWLIENIDETIDKKFLYYLMRTRDYQKFIVNFASWSTVRHTSPDRIRAFEFFLPNKQEQILIAKTLSSFDDKIELLREENQTLEEMWQTLFKERFGKYIVWDELPEGWRWGKLGEVVDHIKINIVPWKEPEKIFSHYSLPAFDEWQKPSKEKWELIMSNKYKVLNKSILISKLNPFFPRIRTIFEPENNAVCSTEFQVLKPKEEIYFSYCHCLLNSQKFTEDISKKVQWTSSSHQRVKPDDILNSEIIIWDEKSINSFNEKFYPMLEKIENNKKQIEILSKTRDQLLPKLMSWEVRVEF